MLQSTTTSAPRVAAPRRSANRTVTGVTERLYRLGPVFLRVSLALVMIWFGALKVANISPVSQLVADTVPFVDGSWFVPLLGGFEVVLGIALLAGSNLLVLTGLVVHLLGTFAVLVTQPELAFQQGNPLLLTVEGEFVVKNLVLLSAGLALAGRDAHDSRQAVTYEGGR
jgi:putative oxidoreductase